MKSIYALLMLLLLAQLSMGQEVITRKLLEASTSWDGTRLPRYPKGQPKVTILKITIPPGSKLPIHQHPLINCAVVMKGELKVVKLTGEEKLIKPGDAIAEVVGSYHYGCNAGKDSVELIVFYAGDETLPLSVKKDDLNEQKANLNH